MLTLRRNTIDISSSVAWDTLAWTNVLTKEVDRLEFFIRRTPAKTIPNVGDTITLHEGGAILFGGVVVERNEKIVGGVLLGYDIRCKDHSHTLDGRLVVKSYGNQSARSIVLDIISTFTRNFTTANVAAMTPTVSTMRFNYEQVSRALTKLADHINWDWFVDANRDIHFFSEEAHIAPFNLDDTSGNYEWTTLEVNHNILNLKNHVFVRGGESRRAFTAANTIDSYIGDGNRRTFPLAYRYDNITVRRGGVVQTIGADQQADPSQVQILYNFNEKFIRFTGTAPTSAETIVVYGNAFIPIIVSMRDQISISQYGEFQHAIVDRSITSVDEAQRRARAELKRFSENVFEGRFKTTRRGLRVGQRITISSVIRGLASRSYKINRINGKARGNDHMEYEVFILASGEVTFTDIMVSLLTKDLQNITIATNEVLQRLEIFSESMTIEETIRRFTRSRPYTWGAGGVNDLISPRGWGFGTWS